MAETSYSHKTKVMLSALKLSTGGQVRAELSAIISTAGSLHIEREGLRIELLNENPALSARVDEMLGRLYSAHIAEDEVTTQFNRTLYVWSIPHALSLRLLQDCGIMTDAHLTDGIPSELLNSVEDKRAYMRGAFLGGGTLNFGAKSGYLLEFNFSRERIAEDFCEAINALELGARIVERNNRFVVYLKDVQEICDVMAHIGATKAVVDIQSVRVDRAMRERLTREMNCDISNMEKSVDAAQKSIRDIQILRAQGGLDTLPERLKLVALAREEHPEISLAELANDLGLTKSCLSHRLAKLSVLAKNTPHQS